MKRRHWLTIGAAVILVVLGAGIFAKRAATKSVKIGVILPLTDAAASLGKASLNGMQLALDDYMAQKQQNEPRIEFVVEDDRAQPALSVSAFRSLLATQKVRLVLGPLTSGATLAVAPVAETNQVLMMSPGASAPAVSEAGDYVFRNELSEALGARAQAELGFSRLNFKSVALLYINNEYGVGTTRVFRDRLSELGGRVVADEAFAPGATDFRTALTKVKAANADAVFVVYQDEIVNVVKQWAELGLTTPIYTTPVLENEETVKKLGRLAEGIVYTYYGTFAPDAKTGPTAHFVSTYQNRFHGDPSYYAALGYDAMRILVEALRKSGFDEGKVKGEIYKIKNFDGVTGQISFDQKGDVTKPITLKVVKGGRFVQY